MMPFEIIFEFITLKKWQKGCIYPASPRGCDVARKAMWLGHADPREPLRGAGMTQVHVFLILYLLYILFYSKYKHPIEELANRIIPSTLYTRSISVSFSMWDYVPFLFLIAGCVA